jgi:lipopolysaccharide export system protein LptA
MKRASLPAGSLLLCLPLAGLLWPLPARALDSDRNQPIEIEADKASLDEQSRTSIYEGNVYLHQGSLRLHGNRMSLTLNNKHIHEIVLDGTPASFAQRPEHADTDQQAEAAHIEYHTDTRRLLLQGNAVIRQAGREEFRSDRIELNLRDNTVQAGSAGGDNRVHITLQPAKVPAPEAPATAPEAPATTPAEPATAPAVPPAGTPPAAVPGGTRP